MKNNLSKLQSEAVKEFRTKFVREDNYQTGVNRIDGFVVPEDIEKFISDQIQKAYSNGREEVLKVIKENHLIEVNNHSDKHLIGNWSGLKHNLSIQSKGK